MVALLESRNELTALNDFSLDVCILDAKIQGTTPAFPPIVKTLFSTY